MSGFASRPVILDTTKSCRIHLSSFRSLSFNLARQEMTFSRRDFIKSTSIALGAVTLPSWVYDAQAATAQYIDVNKGALADVALATAKKLGASYADIRINRYRIESVNTRERQVLNVSAGQNFGFGVRVLVK